MKNKKGGIGFPEFFIIITIIALIFVLLAVNKQLSGAGWTIRDMQLPLLDADIEKNLVLDVIDDGAVPAFDIALQITAERAGFEKDACGGWNYGCAIINSKKDPKNLCLPDISACLNKFFSQELFDLNKKSEIHSLLFFIPYELYVNKSTVRGIPLKEISIDLGMFESNALGDFSFRPSFMIKRDNELGLYPKAIFPVLENVAKGCSDVENPKSCFEGWIPKADDNLEWSSFVDEKDDDLFYFKIKFKKFNRVTCYGLYLPKKGAKL